MTDLRRDPRQVSLLGPEHEMELQQSPSPKMGAKTVFPETKWVKQEHKFGCVLASLAMVLGKTYKEVHDELAPRIWKNVENAEKGCYEWVRGNDFETAGWYIDDAYRWLEEHGYATQMKYSVRFGHTKRKNWPPKPFAPIHMVSVLTQSDTQHAVVMTAEGKVLDPLKEPGTWDENWDFYKKVQHVCGIWRVGKFQSLKYDRILRLL